MRIEHVHYESDNDGQTLGDRLALLALAFRLRSYRRAGTPAHHSPAPRFYAQPERCRAAVPRSPRENFAGLQAHRIDAWRLSLRDFTELLDSLLGRIARCQQEGDFIECRRG